MNYSPVGSSAGIAAISARQVDFGASDVPMNASEMAAAKGGPVTQVPDALGAEGIAHNLNLRADARLHLADDRRGEIATMKVRKNRRPSVAGWWSRGDVGDHARSVVLTGHGQEAQVHQEPAFVPLLRSIAVYSPASGLIGR